MVVLREGLLAASFGCGPLNLRAASEKREDARGEREAIGELPHLRLGAEDVSHMARTLGGLSAAGLFASNVSLFFLLFCFGLFARLWSVLILALYQSALPYLRRRF